MFFHFLTLVRFSESLRSIPSFNYKVSEVKNERNCNASYIFTAISAFESYYATVNNSGSIINFSEQYILSNINSTACNGLSPNESLTVLHQLGTYYEAVYPYYGQYIVLQSTSYPNIPAPSFKFSNSLSSSDFHSLVQKKSLIVRLVYDNSTSFLKYTGTTYSCTSDKVNSHYMLAVYNDTAYSQGLLYLKNNWGVGWGNQGYLVLNLTSDNPKGPCNLYENVYWLEFD